MKHPVIMIVDDEADMLSLLEIALKRQGFAVMKAKDAELALHLVNSFKPNLFIVDVMMPGMDGIELCRELRTIPHTANTPVIIMTAYDSTRFRSKAREAGANSFLPKANMMRLLIEQVHSLLAAPLPRHMH